jgi:hypothetical protein
LSKWYRCLNLGDGQLSKVWDFQHGGLGYISDLYASASHLQQVQDQIKANSNSQNVQSAKTQYDLYNNDIRETNKASNYDENWIWRMFLNSDKYSNALEQGSFQSSCSSQTQDVLRQSQAHCPDDYVYIPGGSDIIGTKSCLTIQSWAFDQIVSRYSSRPTGCTPSSPDFSSFSNAMSSYYTGFRNYMLENTNLLQQLKGEMDNLNQQFIQSAGNLSNSIDNMSGIIQPLLQLFNGIIGPGGYFGDFVNCSK